MIAQLLVYKIMQLFCMMVLGFALVKTKLLKSEDSMVLSKLSLYLFVPAAMLNAFNVEVTDAVLRGLLLAFLAALGIHAVLILLDVAIHKWFKTTNVERASIVFSNAGNLIIPLVSYIFGEAWVIYSSAYMVVTVISCWTYGVKLFSDAKFSIKNILLNVNVIAIFLGFALLLFRLHLPKFIGEITTSLSALLGPAAMLIAGMLAAKVDFKKMIKNKKLYFVLLMRLIICPFVILILLKSVLPHIHIPDMHTIMLIAYLAAITPSASTVVQFAQIYGQDARYATAINVATTIGCIITMPLLVLMF